MYGAQWPSADLTVDSLEVTWGLTPAVEIPTIVLDHTCPSSVWLFFESKSVNHAAATADTASSAPVTTHTEHHGTWTRSRTRAHASPGR